MGNGTNGGNTIVWTGVCMTPGGAGGTGGGTPGGDGGKGAGFTDANCNVTDPAANGGNYGGGGGGGNGNGGPPGLGAGGYCLILYCALDTTTSVSGTTITSNAIAANYQWIDCNNGNLPIAGATDQSFTVPQNGSYAVIVSDGVCNDTSACVDVIFEGVNNIINENGFVIYPNPFTSKISIQNTTGNENYELMNSISQIIWTGKNIEQKDFSGLITGFYFLKMQNQNTIKTVKLLKQ